MLKVCENRDDRRDFGLVYVKWQLTVYGVNSSNSAKNLIKLLVPYTWKPWLQSEFGKFIPYAVSSLLAYTGPK